MAACTGCGRQLPGRRQKCDTCKAATGRPTKRTPAKPRPGSRAPRKKPPAKKAPAAKAPATAVKKTAVKKTAAKKTAAAARPQRPRRRSDTPTGLADRGRALWAEMGIPSESPAGHLALEACRLADRIDGLERIVTKGGLLDLFDFKLGGDVSTDRGRDVHITLEVSKLLSETRQQQLAFKQIMAELGMARIRYSAAAPPAPDPDPEPAPASRSPLDELSQRREQREQTT